MSDRGAITSIILELIRLRKVVDALEEALRMVKTVYGIDPEAKPEPKPMPGFKNFISN